MRLVLRVLTAVLGSVALLLGPALGAVPARADTAPVLTLTGPAASPFGSSAALVLHLTGSDGVAVAGARLLVERQDGDRWTFVADATTGTEGTATIDVPVPPTSPPRTYRARSQDGTTISDTVTVTGTAVETTLTLRMPRTLIDERAAVLHISWTSALGAVPGTVTVERRVPGGPWERVSVRRPDAAGAADLRVRPRRDTEWRVRGGAGAWWQGAITAVHALDNRPPGRAVAYPVTAPEPEQLPAQRHAVGRGPHAVVSRIPRSVWRSMVGTSWHRGCPVGREGLRLVRVNYWDFTGYRRRGEMVVRSTVAGRVAGALSDMYRGHFPIRAMYRVDRFGWSRRSHGGNDFSAMRHDNSSAFNCRWVTGSPGRTSPHSYGTAIDLNTWENPYWSAVGPLPDRWWTGHSDPRVAWRSAAHPVVRIWRRHGFHWTYATGDSQHMDARRIAEGGRPPVEPGGFVAD